MMSQAHGCRIVMALIIIGSLGIDIGIIRGAVHSTRPGPAHQNRQSHRGRPSIPGEIRIVHLSGEHPHFVFRVHGEIIIFLRLLVGTNRKLYWLDYQ